MAEVFIFLFEHLGGAALVLILGFAADQISTPTLKSYVVDLIRHRVGKQKITHPTNFYLSFLNGFIEPIFGKKTLSFSFFIRSCLVSIIFLISAIFLQLIFYGPQTFNQLWIVGYSAYTNTMLLIFLILFIFIIDYISNAKSISLLRMAASSGRPSNVFLIFIADTTLTISIFSIMFPLALVLGLYLAEPFRPSRQVEIKHVQEPLRELVAQNNPSPFPRYSNFKTHAVFLSAAGDQKQTFTTSSPMVYMFASPNQEKAEVLANYVSALKATPNLHVRSLDVLSATVEVNFRPLLRALFVPLLIALEREADVNRVVEVGYHVFTLVPFVIRFSTVYSNFQNYYQGPQFLTTLCESGQVHNTSSYRPIEQIEIPCEPKLLFISKAPDLNWKFRIASSTGDGFSESPFFFSSFALANLYYALMLLFIAGVFLVRIISYMFSTPHLESTTKPFTLLSAVLFPVFVLLSVLPKLV
jgi:hypothetical protein